jgi:hypothetical protein
MRLLAVCLWCRRMTSQHLECISRRVYLFTCVLQEHDQCTQAPPASLRSQVQLCASTWALRTQQLTAMLAANTEQHFSFMLVTGIRICQEAGNLDCS